jgi:hypothetical protein
MSDKPMQLVDIRCKIQSAVMFLMGEKLDCDDAERKSGQARCLD